MKSLAATVLSSLVVLLCLAPGKSSLARPTGEEEKKRATPDREALEKKFQETLTGATLAGRWRLVRDGKLDEEKEEKYTISRVTKAAGDTWIIFARIQYGGKDVTIPVPVKVHWAGDTPTIAVTEAGLPGLGTYTARVMVYNDLYTGTWFGRDHGGFLSGTITRAGTTGDGDRD